MKYKFQFVFINLLTLFFLFLNSCSPQDDELLSIGNNFVEPNTRVAKVDTFGISLSTIILDSIATSNTEIAIVGYSNDKETGSVAANSFFQIGVPASDLIQTDDIFDSVALVLNYSSYYHGDTTSLFSLSVNEVAEDIDVFDDGYLYNNSSFNYLPISLGTKSFYPRPNSNKEVVIRLQDYLGNDLFEKLKYDDDEITDNTEFINYLKGLVLLSNNNINQSVIGFNLTDSTLCLRLYARRIGEEVEEFEVDFPVINNSSRFNQFAGDRNNTILEQLTEQRDELHSSKTNDFVFIKGGAGLMTTISFPWLTSLIEINNGELFRAELVLYPIINDSNSGLLPSNFLLYEGGKYNAFEGTYADADGNPYYATVEKDILYNSVSITFDLTEYIKHEISDSYYETDKTFILSYNSPEHSNSVNQVKIGGFGNEKYCPKLNVYFIHSKVESND